MCPKSLQICYLRHFVAIRGGNGLASGRYGVLMPGPLTELPQAGVTTPAAATLTGLPGWTATRPRAVPVA